MEEIGPKTKLNDILTAYPFIKDYLIALSPHFKALDNPFMMRTMGRLATLGKVAMVGGVELTGLLKGIADEIRKKSGVSVAIKAGEAPEGPGARLEILKGIIRDLHKGVDLGVLKERFRELIKDVEPSEIANMEQQLIEEGMPEEEVKRLCDVHVEVFKESLAKQTVPGLPAGHPVHTFMLENRAAEGIIKEMEALVEDTVKNREGLQGLLERLSQVERHYVRKENQLFPILEAKGISGPSKVMWALHDDIRAMMKDVKGKTSKGSVKEVEVKALVHMIRDMVYKEENILFPMALETLDEEDWAKVRKGEDEIGYAWVEPELKWQPSAASYQQALLAEKVGSLNLDTGQLTAEQVNLLLTHLPVDISFVNENDEVAYYSQTPERIFPRSPGIIGRTVQNCHPPKSVNMVVRILEEFKAGNRDTAEFWIQMRGKVIHIRYFAVRDAGGRYRGTMEVSQDITDIQKLTGEKRLLEWQ
jgi:DUF438 domain-containing protein